MKKAKNKTVKRSEVTKMAMLCGGEKKYTKIIIDGKLNEWVGIGWIDISNHEKADKRKYPTLED